MISGSDTHESVPSKESRSVRVIRGIDGLEDVQNTHLGYSGWVTVTQSMIDQFADVTGDRKWIQTGFGRTAQGPHDGTTAHRFLILSLIPKLLWQIYRLEGFGMEVNYGLDRVRFPCPLRPASRVRASARLVKVTSSKGGGALATIRVEIRAESSTRPACLADTLVFLRD